MTDNALTDPAQQSIETAATFARNLQTAWNAGTEVWMRMLQTEAEDDHPLHADPLNTVPAFANLYQTMMDHPQEMGERITAYWADQAELWRRASMAWWGVMGEPMVDASRDKRFKHEDWSRNAALDFIKQSYLMTSRWWCDTVSEVGDLDPRERKKVAFYTQRMMEAACPVNFAHMNPEVIEATLASKGENLVKGMQMMTEDVERGKGKLLIRQTDMDKFEVGRDMAMTPGKVVFQNNIFQLIQYTPTTDEVHEKPLLIIPPWINKYYVLDLNEKKSMVRWLVGQGHTVFMVSWINPGEAQKDETWESYLFDGALTAVDKAIEASGAEQVNVASYCVGATMTATMMAWLGKTGDDRVASATFFTALTDFEEAGELQVFVDEGTLAVVDEQMDKGFLPAQSMQNAFNLLRSSDLIWNYVINNYYLGKDPFPFDLLYWNSDSTSMAAKVHHFYLDQFYNQNAFTKGELVLGGQTLSPADITAPVYHIATVEDHIAPAADVYRGAKNMVNAPMRFVLGGSGHIAGVVNHPDLGKYQYWISDNADAPDLASWREGSENHPGSWWIDWDAWLATHSDGKAPARQPGQRLPAIMDAPGSYVLARFDA